jgi:uncharacterized protein (TIGR02391 family)
MDMMQSLASEWITAAEAVQLLKPGFDGSAQAAKIAICKRAHAGLIRARATRYIVDRETHNNCDIPERFWWAEGDASLEQDWTAGDFDTWYEHKIHLRAFGVSFLRADIEKIIPAPGSKNDALLRAYQGLDLHPEIARAASKLYQDGHYSNAVEAAVKALNNLVRLRSGLEIDGMTLMQQAFSPNKPVLKFNDLSDQSDRDEQTGFMMMFSGAVAGLRNPRAHGFIQDDPERALEFIAYVSLLAKLLDGATRV